MLGLFPLHGDCCTLVCQIAVPTLAHSWPGYIQWNPNEVVTLEYMNRYYYCEIRKHTAQELDGPNARHETSACPKRGGQQA